MSNGKQKTIADVAAQMRELADRMEKRDLYDLRECGTDYLRALADLIEAAHKREILVERNLATDHIVALQDKAVKIYGEICEMIGREATREKSSQVGNAAKMREALEAVVKVGYPHNFMNESPHIRYYCYGITRAIAKCIDALANPPRNCDRLSADKCKQIFKMEMEFYLPQEATDNDREIAQRTAYGVIDALFAPYTEQKGETDESK